MNRHIRQIRRLRAEGLSVRQISRQLGLTDAHVRRELGEAALLLIRLPGRPDWSVPDAALLKLARAARAEIEAAEGFVRPQP